MSGYRNVQLSKLPVIERPVFETSGYQNVWLSNQDFDWMSNYRGISVPLQSDLIFSHAYCQFTTNL